MLLHLTCAFEIVTLLNERVIALFHHFFITFSYNFDISLKSMKKDITLQLQRPPVPCILQILTTFNLYSGGPRVGLSVNNKEKVRQAMVKISRFHPPPPPPPPPLARYVSRNVLTIGGLIIAYKLYMEYKTTTKLKQSTLWRRLKLIMTHNFTE